MNDNLNRPGTGDDGTGTRKSVVIIIAMLLFAVIGAGYVLYQRSKAPPETAAAPELPVAESSQPAEAAPVAKPVEPAPGQTVRASASATAQIVPRSATNPPVQPTTAPTYGNKIINALVQLNMTNGPVTPEKLAAWKSTLQMLTNQGPAAISAIREFLQGKQDVNFDSIGGSSVMGQPSMRLAVLDSLLQIGGAEANALAAETMRSTSDPREIAIIARNLEHLAPGEFTQAALDAARAALAQARDGRISNVDVGGLFDVLARYGGADAIQDFQDAKGKWTYYSTIALGGLPDGKGIPALVSMIQDTSGNSASLRSAALPSLAQWADSSTDARNALLEQAHTGQIGGATWIRISAVLGGEQVYIGSDGENGILPPSELKKSKTHLAFGPQDFYTISVLDRLSAEQINQRIQLIDQLLVGNSNPTATTALQTAKSSLQSRLPK